MDRLKTIIVAIDFSSCSDAAMATAFRLAEQSGAEVIVLHAVQPFLYDRTCLDEAAAVQVPTTQQLIEHAALKMREAVAALSPSCRVRQDVVAGHTFGTILDWCQRVRPDLLVLGTHSTLHRHRGIGTTAAASVRKAECKVLLVREDQTRPFTNVAAFVDFSATSREALGQAVRVAAQDDAALHVVHIYDDPWHGMPRSDIVTANMPDFDTKMKLAVEERLRAFCEPLSHEMNALKARYHGFQYDEHWEGYGSGITGFIARHGVDLAVLGVRSTWNVRDFFMGSTAERVCRDAGCSILTVRPVPEAK